MVDRARKEVPSENNFGDRQRRENDNGDDKGERGDFHPLLGPVDAAEHKIGANRRQDI